MAQGLGTAVDSEVLGAGGGLHGLAISLQAPDVGLAQPGGEVGVLAVGLMAPAPPGVTENVDVGGPVGQALVDVPVAQGREGIVLGPSFGGGDVAQPLQQSVVEHGGHADGLGEAGGGTGPGNAVQGFVPPVVGGDVQPGDGGGIIAQLAGHFLHGHLGNLGPCFFLCGFTILGKDLL